MFHYWGDVKAEGELRALSANSSLAVDVAGKASCRLWWQPDPSRR
jgi:hypothetical protein